MAEPSDKSPHSNREVSEKGEETTASAEVQSQRLEELLLDQDDSDPVDALIGREVTPIAYEHQASVWLVFLFFLTLLVAIGLFWVVYRLYHHEQPSPQFTATVVEIKQPIPARPLLPQTQLPLQQTDEQSDSAVDSADKKPLSGVEKIDPSPALPTAEEQNLYTLVVGPFITSEGLGRAEQILAELGMQTEQQPGRGMVRMFRLLEGVYPSGEAEKRLKHLRQIVDSAFLLPQKENKALYAGSFFDQERALLFQTQLQQQQLNVTVTQVEVAMDGTSLVALKTDNETAQQLADLLVERGLKVQVSLDQ